MGKCFEEKGTVNINEAKATKSSDNSLLKCVSDFSHAGCILSVGSLGNSQLQKAVCGGPQAGVTLEAGISTVRKFHCD